MPNLNLFVLCFVTVFLITCIGAYLLRKKINPANRGPEYFIEFFFFFFIPGIFAPIPITVLLEHFATTNWSENYSTTQLVSVGARDGVYGNFFLGSGEISSQSYYTYFQKEDGGFRKASLSEKELPGSQSKILVFEEERTDGELRVYSLEYNEDFVKKFLKHPDSKKYEFHIPKGSIQREFKLN